MQPLDVAYFSPLMTYYNDEATKWLRSHIGRVITQFQVAALFSKAFLRASTMQTAVNAFKSTGIVPLNADIFPEHLFTAAETTDIGLAVGPLDSETMISIPLHSENGADMLGSIQLEVEVVED